jgi:hypothetical protein
MSTVPCCKIDERSLVRKEFLLILILTDKRTYGVGGCM